MAAHAGSVIHAPAHVSLYVACDVSNWFGRNIRANIQMRGLDSRKSRRDPKQYGRSRITVTLHSSAV